MNSQEVLRKPFDIGTHKKTFIDYLEIVITEDGTVMYAVPSHQEKLIALACEKLQVTRDELNDLCPEEYYFDFMTWLCQVSGCVALWNDRMLGKANEQQARAVRELADNGLYYGNIPG